MPLRRLDGVDDADGVPVDGGDTYTHVLIDGRELDYAALLEPP